MKTTDAASAGTALAALAAVIFLRDSIPASLAVALIYGAAAGLLFGRKGTVRGFFLGALPAILPALAFAACANERMAKVNVFLRGFECFRLYPDQLGRGICLIFLCGTVAGAFVLYWIFFLCRKRVSTFPEGVLLGILASAALYFLPVPAYYGILALVLLAAPEETVFRFQQENPPVPVFLILLSVLAGLLVWWTILNFRRTEKGFFPPFRDLLYFCGGCAGIFLLAYLAAYACGGMVLWSNPSAGGRLAYDEILGDSLRNYEQTVSGFCGRNPDFHFFADGVYRWLPPESTQTPIPPKHSMCRLVPEKVKAETLRIAASPEGAGIFRADDEMMEKITVMLNSGKGHFTVSGLEVLMRERMIARRLASRAMFAHYRGRTEDIPPLLDSGRAFADALRNHRTTILEALISTAVDSVLDNTEIRIGPESPELAGRYRKRLAEVSARTCDVPDETPIQTEEVRRIMKTGWSPKAVLTKPALLAGAVRTVGCLKKYASETARTAKDGRIAVPDSGFGKMYASCLLKQKLNIVSQELAFALKVFRCENGKSPETPDALVPGILSAVPVDPATGETPDYRVFPNGHFAFRYSSSDLWISSEPVY